MPRDEVGMQVRLDHMADREVLLLRFLQIHLDVALRADNCGLFLGSDHVRGVRQAAEIELFKEHT